MHPKKGIRTRGDRCESEVADYEVVLGKAKSAELGSLQLVAIARDSVVDYKVIYQWL